MKKIGIITLTGYFNYGNRLQNYALTKVLEKEGYEVYTIWNNSLKEQIKNKVKTMCFFKKKYHKTKYFYKFSKRNMKEFYLKNNDLSYFDYLVIGSDQVWNPKYIDENNFLLYKPTINQNVFSYAASLGVENIPEKYHSKFIDALKNYKAISVREESGKKAISKVTDKKIEVVLDPTLLLNSKEWLEIQKKPKKMEKKEKYILCYFLGEPKESEKNSIKEYAKKNNYKIINLTDPNDDYYSTGPEEFVYLINNSIMVCTDSFHACVFSFIFNKPFVVFKRKGCSDYMYSRIDNLIKKFNLKNREYNGVNINDLNLMNNYEESYKILENEKSKSINYIIEALSGRK